MTLLAAGMMFWPPASHAATGKCRPTLLTALDGLGSVVGSRIGGRVSNTGPQRGFAGFLVVMGLFVLGGTLDFNLPGSEAGLAVTGEGRRPPGSGLSRLPMKSGVAGARA